MDPKQQLIGVALAVAGVLTLSPDALLVRLIEAERATLLFWRALLEGLTLLAAITLIHRGRVIASVLAMGRWGIVATLNFAVSTILFVSSITLTTAANTLFMLATAPLFAALISRLFLRERIARRTAVAIGCAFIGIGIIFAGGIGGGTLAGDVLGLAAAISLAAQLSVARHARHVNLVPALALGMLLVAALVGTTFAEPFNVGDRDWLWLGLMGLVVVPLAFGLLTLAPRYIPSPEVGLIMQLEAVLGPLWVWLVVSEVPATATFVGGAIVLATLTVHSLLGIRAYRRRGRDGDRVRPIVPH